MVIIMYSTFFYSILCETFYQENLNKPLSFFDKMFAVLLNIQILLQNIYLLWSPNLHINSWKSDQQFWVFLAYPCIDRIFAALNSLSILLLLVALGLSITLFLIALHISLSLNRIKTPLLFIKIERFLIFLLSDVFFIPFTIVLVILFKYSTVDITFIQEYSNNPSSSSFQLGRLGQVLSIGYLGLMLMISLISDYCKYELRHSLTDKTINAKSFSYIDGYTKIVYFISAVFSCVLQANFYIYHLILASFSYGLIWYSYAYRLTYYLNFMNFLKIALHFEVFCVSIFFIVGYLANDPMIIIILTVFMQPFIISITKLGIDYRISKIKTLEQEVKSDFILFEISARKSLLSPEKSENVIKFINKNYSATKNEILLIIQAYYCNDILKNSALGSIKLSRVNPKSVSFFSGFQVYKCYKFLEAVNKKASEGFELCIYLLSIDAILNKEKKLCKNLVRLWNKILDPKCEFDSLNKFLRKSVHLMKDVKAKYLENLLNHPLSQQMNQMFGTILTDMLGEPDVGRTYLERFNSNIRKTAENKKQSFSDEDACIMIISGSD